MDVKETKVEGLLREFLITIPSKSIQTDIDSKLQAIGRTVKIPGFRPGKIPSTLLNQRYGENVQNEVIEKLTQDAVLEVLKDKKLRAAMRPEVKLSEYKKGNDIECSVSLEIMPEIAVPDYSSFTFERIIAKPTLDEVDKAKDNLSLSFGKTEELKKPRPIQDKDILSVDLKTFVEGKEIPDASAKDYIIELGTHALPQEVENACVGKTIEDTITSEVVFPQTLKSAHAGKKGHYEVTIRKIFKKVKATLDDDFAKELGYKDISELDKDVSKRLSTKYDDDSFTYVKRHILDKLANVCHFEIPNCLLEAEFQSIWNQLQKSLMDKSSKPLDKQQEEKLQKEYRLLSNRRVRLGLLLGEIGRINNIEVPEKMIHQSLANQAREYPGKEKQIIDYYMKNPEAMASIRAPLYENLIIQHIIDKATIQTRDVSPEELAKEVDKILNDEAID